MKLKGRAHPLDPYLTEIKQILEDGGPMTYVVTVINKKLPNPITYMRLRNFCKDKNLLPEKKEDL